MATQTASASSKISGLLRERDGILKQLAKVNEALVRAALSEVKSSPVELPSLRGAGKAAKSKRRSWFERGEALTLVKKLATKPTTQADLVRALGHSKGYAKSLSGADLKRFQSAAYQAIANAIARKQLVQSKDGTVTAKA